jgi:hypothetical protein
MLIQVPQAAWLALLPLLGTVVGAFSTYLATRHIEERRWRQRKTDERAQATREAIAHAYEASGHVNRFLWSALRRVEDEQEDQATYEKEVTAALEAVTSKMESAALSPAVLSPSLRDPTWETVKQITEFGSISWAVNHGADDEELLKEHKARFFSILTAIATWRTTLPEEYARTFE